MGIVIDTKKGIAGDIVSAGLIGLGADETRLLPAMEYAGNQIGSTRIELVNFGDVKKLEVSFKEREHHLLESKAKKIFSKVAEDLSISRPYSDIGSRALSVLCEAERWVHKRDIRLSHMIDQHEAGEEAVLHEAKDILIDIVGLSVGLMDLRISDIYYLDWVNVGSGTVQFSHGEFEVPAPATEYVLNEHNIIWKKSETGEEMTTPTGASILAGCRAKRMISLEGRNPFRRSLSRGTKNLPPVPFYLIE
ncbi:MAG TPA: LarC family nickel insertion protein [Thermoplasmata archaeon]|nr:LarC family nickel insertion protein [Thermoplasmata archaeon]